MQKVSTAPIEPISSVDQPEIRTLCQPSRWQIDADVKELGKQYNSQGAYDKDHSIGTSCAHALFDSQRKPQLDTGRPEDDALRDKNACRSVSLSFLSS